jgi:hypothetical protein
VRGTESLFGHYGRHFMQAWELVRGCGFREIHRNFGTWGRSIAQALPRSSSAPEADRVIAGYVQIHSVLTARSEMFA